MARGVILLAIADAGLPLVELTPNQVKQGIAGWGGADKKQVEGMVQRLLKLAEPPKPDDAADALAIAIVGGLVYRTAR
jgi:crossover junction endodeoxyribonuclease RuvC